MKTVETGHMDEAATKQAVSEAQLMAKFDSPYLVNFHDTFFDHQAQRLYIIMEYCAFGRKKSQSPPLCLPYSFPLPVITSF
jgi:serine/threonine protein kinase